MSSNSKPRIHGPTIAEKVAIVKHAKDLFIKMASKGYVTRENVKGLHAEAEAAIEMAELFHEALVKKGYEND